MTSGLNQYRLLASKGTAVSAKPANYNAPSASLKIIIAAEGLADDEVSEGARLLVRGKCG